MSFQINLPGPKAPSRKIYLMQQLTNGHLSTGGPVKIGMSKNVRRRKTQLQQSSAHEIDILKVFEVEKAPEVEMWLHDRFWNLQMRGEWFHSHPRILNFEPEHDRYDRTEAEGHIAESLQRRDCVVKRCVDPWGLGDNRLFIKTPVSERTLFYNPDTGRVLQHSGCGGPTTITPIGKSFHDLIMFMRRNDYPHTKATHPRGV